MTEEEIKRFNFLEAATRVYLTDVHKQKQACVFPRVISKWRCPTDKSYYVRYRDGHYFIVAHIGKSRVMFKQRARAKLITNVSVSQILKYLETRTIERKPAVLLR